jgi:hypothetical protein
LIDAPKGLLDLLKIDPRYFMPNGFRVGT